MLLQKSSGVAILVSYGNVDCSVNNCAQDNQLQKATDQN